MHEIKLWDLEVIHALVSLPGPSANVEDCLFVVVEKLEGGSDMRELNVIKFLGLCKVPEVHEGIDGNDEGWWSFPSNNTNDKPLDIIVHPSSDLFEARDTIFEVFEANNWLYSCEPKVKFICSNDLNRPFDIMVPELLVPMVEGFWSKEYGWIR